MTTVLLTFVVILSAIGLIVRFRFRRTSDPRGLGAGSESPKDPKPAGLNMEILDPDVRKSDDLSTPMW